LSIRLMGSAGYPVQFSIGREEEISASKIERNVPQDYPVVHHGASFIMDESRSVDIIQNAHRIIDKSYG
jgi:hypothetical protein